MRFALALLLAGGCSYITDFATHDGGAGADGSVDARGRSNPDAARCPDVLGAYTIVTASGAGCGDFNATAAQCILATSETCFVHFKSEGGAVNGGAALQSDGSFSGA